MSSTGAGLAAKIAQNCRRWDRICRERCGARCICILVCRREDAYGFTNGERRAPSGRAGHVAHRL